ncbi:MAG: CHRD domain-containing protein [Rubrivivax sp.]|nr:CHRD domain-containing protein [Rubrivivax sp.]
MQAPSPLARVLFGALAALAVAGASATGPRHPHDDDDEFEATLRGYSEVPAVSSVARGRFKARLDKASQTLRYELTYSGLEGDVRQAHIHFGQHHTNGGIMVWLCQTSANVDPTGLSPVCPQAGSVTGTLSAANVIGPSGQGVAANEFAEFLAALRAGAGYVNVHSTKFPGGEIRGQVRGD